MKRKKMSLMAILLMILFGVIGGTVATKSINVRFISNNINTNSYEQPDGTWLVENVDISYDTTPNYSYSSIPYLGFIAKSNDGMVMMNDSDVQQYWETAKIFYIGSGENFTMPNHGVLLIA